MFRACHTLAISLNDRITHEKISRKLADADYRWTIVSLQLCYSNATRALMNVGRTD